MLTRIKLLLFISQFIFLLAQAEEKKQEFCETSKEFITTMEYLKENKKYFHSQPVNVDIANNVATGCAGAAKRFIDIFTVLSKVGFPAHTSVKKAIEVANKSDKHSEAFQIVFKQGYLKKHLDFDLFHALKFTNDVLNIHKDSVSLAREDFSKFISFCIEQENLDLAKPKCADFSIKMARISAKHKISIFDDFKRTFNFLTQEKRGPGLVTYAGFKEAQNIIEVSPVASRNFISAYRYMYSKKGMGYSIQDAMRVAKKLSFKSRSIASEPKAD